MTYNIQPANFSDYDLKKIPTAPKYENDDSKIISNISHGCHLNSAFAIISDGCIRVKRICDAIIPKHTEINAIWLSPNTWQYDWSLYGGIHFIFNHRRCFTNKRFYWLGIKKTTPRSCIFLVTDKNYEGIFESYDVINSCGPLRFNPKIEEYYFNKKYNIELMFDCDFPLENILRHEIRIHHPTYCNLRLKRCNEKSYERIDYILLFYSKLLLDRQIDLLKIDFDGSHHKYFDMFINKLLALGGRASIFKGKDITANNDKIRIIDLLLYHISKNDLKKARDLVTKFSNYDEYARALLLTVSSLFRAPDIDLGFYLYD